MARFHLCFSFLLCVTIGCGVEEEKPKEAASAQAEVRKSKVDAPKGEAERESLGQ